MTPILKHPLAILKVIGEAPASAVVRLRFPSRAPVMETYGMSSRLLKWIINSKTYPSHGRKRGGIAE